MKLSSCASLIKAQLNLTSIQFDTHDLKTDPARPRTTVGRWSRNMALPVGCSVLANDSTALELCCPRNAEGFSGLTPLWWLVVVVAVVRFLYRVDALASE